MKKLMALFALFCLPSAYAACPNLEGHWNCEANEGGSTSMDVTQEDIPGGVLYKMVDQKGDTFNYPADGALHQIEDENSTGTIQATCISNSQVHSVNEARARDNSFYVKVYEDMNLSRANEIQASAKTHLEYSGTVEEHEYQSVCHKN